MKRPIAILGSILFALSFAAHAVIVTPLPGVSGQTAQQGTYFANKPAVLVTTDAGQPIPDVQVNFIVPGGVAFFTAADNDFSGHDYAVTDANGIASATDLMAYVPGNGEIDVTALTDHAMPIAIPLSVIPGGPTRFEVVSGANQHATVGTLYAQPWVAQAFDASGNVVPYAAVQFYSTVDPTLPSVTFDGAHSIWVRADANGIAVSPYPTANDVSGHDEGLAMSSIPGVAVQFALFPYSNLSGGGGGGGGTGDGCGRQGKGNGNCGNSPAHSGGNGNNGNGKG